MTEPDTPPGWSYNPASWPERLPIVATAAVGFLIAGYLALYQARVFPTVWDPAFGDGSRVVLNSWVAKWSELRSASRTRLSGRSGTSPTPSPE